MSVTFRPSGRVVVTGMGVVSPLGVGTDVTWRRLVAGDNAIRTIQGMDTEGYATNIAAELPDFDPLRWVDKKEARRLDKVLIFAQAAAQMAVDDAGFPVDDSELAEKTGVVVGSGIGGLKMLGDQTQKLWDGGPSRISPFLVPYMIPDMCSGIVSIRLGLKGPNSCVVTACATGTMSIGNAYHMIKRGDAPAMVAGGTEAPINAIGLAGFAAAKAMSTRNDDPAHASRPFDAERDGFVMGEGAAVLMLEDLALAEARGANIIGEIVGYGMSGDAYHITAPDPEGDGAYRSIRYEHRRDRLHQRARHIYRAERQAGDEGCQAAVWRWCL
jgi:3-oxoacyl-[acyl-carrier-protein] synthase II